MDGTSVKMNANEEKKSENNNYAESETMSTSALEETSTRLKELEGSWEERYSKLRSLAIKLKAKIKEQEAVIANLWLEKDDVQKKHLKDVQNLQFQIDQLQDKLNRSETEKKRYLDRLNDIGEGIARDKEQLASNDEIMSNLRKEVECLANEKQATDIWKKQISAKVQTLRKELEANNVLKKEFEGKIAKLSADLDEKDKQLKLEQESHQETRNLLEQTTSEVRKNSVLNLEMKDYERSVKELSLQLERQKDIVNKLQQDLENEKTTIAKLRDQNKSLEEKLHSEENKVGVGASELESCKKKIEQLELVVRQKDTAICDVRQLLEAAKSENEDLSVELSTAITEYQKTLNSLLSEKEELKNQVLSIQQTMREAQNLLKLKEDELKVLQEEYEGYKIRAQSVLRQNQTRDPGLEEKLSEELEAAKTRHSRTLSSCKELEDKKALLETTNKILAKEKGEYENKCRALEGEVSELKGRCAELVSRYQKAVAEHTETVRSLKVHTETLSQCYRQQIVEQETRHNKEILELQSRLEKSPSPIEPIATLLGMSREEAEGSESAESGGRQPIAHPIPLERLLDSPSDNELEYLKKQVGEQESRLHHLTSLLSDTEKDLEKHVQMNKLLKEEIRRQQRSVERERHAENLEYLKNVVFKFVTLSGGDERVRLVPVLNTILKLSPDEVSKLSAVAKGEIGNRGWTGYLTAWPSARHK
ncbi:GRIP and coiled-coil domain-containing protein 2 [Cylas formicarius]|uniref:GRIP and coiled-coil domain-containing protein 2 n=1 Tax=Cylas formicarius TaxID=197179 RepID=UPI00295890FF|nr:GRIP and coiled-coil domain-containing protein 2 [Cylas formicarius]XP_060526033.1 GRIP and coiled-coil domain-containing protein 2 [Cylas formicarius]XP_060526035.1 GRIP and coiled-coil domain-containing protein 2 [Cylas formicarius]